MDLLIGALFAGCQGDPGSVDAILAEDRPFPVDDAQVVILGLESVQDGRKAPAEPAVVIEELDDGHGAVAISADMGVLAAAHIGKQIRGQVPGRLGRCGCGPRLLPPLEFLQRADHDIGVAQKGLADDGLDRFGIFAQRVVDDLLHQGRRVAQNPLDIGGACAELVGIHFRRFRAVLGAGEGGPGCECQCQDEAHMGNLVSVC